MYNVRELTIGKAHESIIGLILDQCDFIETEDKEATMELGEPLCVHVTHPMETPQISECMRMGPMALFEYIKKVLEITPNKGDGLDAVYTYGNRFRGYPTWNYQHESYEGNGDPGGIDQFDLIVKRLKGNLTTRRAIAITWAPFLDGESPEPPCVQNVQFLYRNGGLNLISYIRSNDMLSAWGQNALALSHLLAKMAEATGTQVGYMETISASAHLYYRRDVDELNAFRRKLNI